MDGSKEVNSIPSKQLQSPSTGVISRELRSRPAEERTSPRGKQLYGQGSRPQSPEHQYISAMVSERSFKDEQQKSFDNLFDIFADDDLEGLA